MKGITRVFNSPANPGLGFIAVLLLIIGPRLVVGAGAVVDDETCLACHDDQEVVFADGPHRLMSLGGDDQASIQCTSCHAGGEQHIEDPSTENITNPDRLTGMDARGACLGCHKPHLNLDNFGFDPHSEQAVNCASCHKVHAGQRDHLLSDDPDFCNGCHKPVAAAFTRRSRHPLGQGDVTCLSCHAFGSRADQSVRLDQRRICQDCHPDFTGPFRYEHPAANAYMVEGGGCVECHNPHGSENDKLLKQPDEGLCQQCHVTPAGHLNLPALHGPVRNVSNCVACHSEIHGSFVSSKFLDPMLQARLGSPQACGDCHELTR